MRNFKVLRLMACVAVAGVCQGVSAQVSAAEDYGIQMVCSDTRDSAVPVQSIKEYLASKGIPAEWLQVSLRPGDQTTIVRLAPAMALPSTLDISKSARFSVSADLVELLDPRRQAKQVPTVSQKEILLALLHPGRLTRFTGAGCGLEQLKDNVGVRQMTVAWAQAIQFDWPNGESASWNKKYWVDGTPPKGVDLTEALTDALINSEKYSIGCYTAAKMVLAGAALDYYSRVKRSPSQAARVAAALQADGDPLVNIEPTDAWNFLPAYVDDEQSRSPGKILDVHRNVNGGNYIPGDWMYLLNPDENSRENVGYEGSNAIYLGMNRFSDYYKDHGNSFSFQQKVNEVYQWRHGVYSRTRDADKAVPLNPQDYAQLSRSPANGGLLADMRIVPRPF